MSGRHVNSSVGKCRSNFLFFIVFSHLKASGDFGSDRLFGLSKWIQAVLGWNNPSMAGPTCQGTGIPIRFCFQLLKLSACG